MKIEMGYGDENRGTAETQGDTIVYAGANPKYVQSIVEDYADMSGKTGDDLLNIVIGSLRGRTWARKV